MLDGFVALVRAFLHPRNAAARIQAHDGLVALIGNAGPEGALAQSLALIDAAATQHALSTEDAALVVFASQLVLQCARQLVLQRMLPVLLAPPDNLPAACTQTLVHAAAVVCATQAMDAVDVATAMVPSQRAVFLACLNADQAQHGRDRLLSMLDGAATTPAAMAACANLECTLADLQRFAPVLLRDVLERACSGGGGGGGGGGDAVACVYAVLANGGPSTPDDLAALAARLPASLLPALAQHHALTVEATSTLCLRRMADAVAAEDGDDDGYDEDVLDAWMDPPDHLAADVWVAEALLRACLRVDDEHALWARESLLAFVDAWPQFTRALFDALVRAAMATTEASRARALYLLGAMARREDVLDAAAWEALAGLLNTAAAAPTAAPTAVEAVRLARDLASWCARSERVLACCLDALAPALLSREAEELGAAALLEVARAIAAASPRKKAAALQAWRAKLQGAVQPQTLARQSALVEALVTADGECAPVVLETLLAQPWAAACMDGVARCVCASPAAVLQRSWPQLLAWCEQGRAADVCARVIGRVPAWAWQEAGEAACANAAALCLSAWSSTGHPACLSAIAAPVTAAPALAERAIAAAGRWPEDEPLFRVARLAAGSAVVVEGDALERALARVERGRAGKDTWALVAACAAAAVDDERRARVVARVLWAASHCDDAQRPAARLLAASPRCAEAPAVAQVRARMGEAAWARVVGTF